MFQRVVIALITVCFILFSSTGLMALEKGNKRKGKYSYRKVYKACFTRGEVQSKTPPISPADKTRAEWDQIFGDQNFVEFGCAEEWASVDEKAMTDIYTYLHEYASDSPNPATCK